jgi:hypothetical protein
MASAKASLTAAAGAAWEHDEGESGENAHPAALHAIVPPPNCGHLRATHSDHRHAPATQINAHETPLYQPAEPG